MQLEELIENQEKQIIDKNLKYEIIISFLMIIQDVIMRILRNLIYKLGEIII